MRGLVPCLCGVFLALGHDVVSFGPFHGVIGLVIVMLVLRRAGPINMAVFGWLLGLGYFGWTLRWIVEPFLVDVARHGWMAPFAIVFMAGGLALFWAVAFWAARRMSPANPLVWLPVTFTAAELARGHVLSGFPWGLLPYTLIGGAGDVWLAWIGPYGTTAVMVAFAVALAFVASRHWLRAVGGVALVALLNFGLFVLTPRAFYTTGQTVRLVQPNAPQHQKWDPAWMGTFFDRAVGQTAAGAPVDVVIWPETSVPALLNNADPWLAEMSRAARGAPVVAGIQRREGDDYFNSAVLIEAPDTLGDVVDKAQLVPFGEYIPLARFLGPLGLGTLVDQVAGFSPGTGDGLMQIEGLGLARVLICYEGIFPEDMRGGGDMRPDILLIITNDAWFGTGAGPRQHLAQAQARAIEQGLPVVRAANTGISAVIDARGRIVDRLPLNSAGYLDAEVPAALPVTLYARMGDWPLAVLLVVCIGASAARRRPIVVDATQRQR